MPGVIDVDADIANVTPRDRLQKVLQSSVFSVVLKAVCWQCFDLYEQLLGVPQLLEPEDLIGRSCRYVRHRINHKYIRSYTRYCS